MNDITLVLRTIKSQIESETGEAAELSEKLQQKYRMLAKLTKIEGELDTLFADEAEEVETVTPPKVQAVKVIRKVVPKKGRRKFGDPPTIDQMLDRIMKTGEVFDIDKVMESLGNVGYTVQRNSVNTTMHRRAKQRKVLRVSPGKFRISSFPPPIFEN